MTLAPLLALAILLDPRSVTDQFVRRAREAEDLIEAGKLAEACAIADELLADDGATQPMNWRFLLQSGGADAVPLLAGKLFKAGETVRARALLVAAAPLCIAATPVGLAEMKTVLAGDALAAWETVRKCTGRSVTLEALGLDPPSFIPILEKRLADGVATEEEVVFMRDQLVLQRSLRGTLPVMRAAARRFPSAGAVLEGYGDAAALEGESREALAAFDAAAGVTSIPPTAYENSAAARIWTSFYPSMRRPQSGLPPLVKLAATAAAAGLREEAERRIDAHAGRHSGLQVADAWFELGAFGKAAPLFRAWLRKSSPRRRDGMAAMLVAETVRRLIVCHVELEEPFQALLARRAFLPEAQTGGAYFDEVLGILARNCEEALDPVRAQAVPGESLMEEFLEAQTCTPDLRRRARIQAALLRSEDPAVRQAASVELVRLGPASAQALIDSVRGEDPEADGRLLQIVHEWATEFAESGYRE
ncbi:MAG: hypothetical protein HYY18_03020 [Planctomycetes bacterium]|nr:hypothetical protein [Planctomycetota bacterium]